MICPYCKETILDGAIKCRYCGSILDSDANCSINADSITADEMRAFVGANADYYLRAFLKYNRTGVEKFVPTWNWSCTGFTFLWFLYRKMYTLSLVTFIVFCLPGINVLLHIFVGVVGNYLYYRHVKQSIFEIRATQSSQNYIPVLQEIGGVNRWVITGGIILSIILALLFFMFFATIITFIVDTTKITI